MLPPDYVSPSLGKLMQIVKAEAGISYPTLQAFLDAFDPSWAGVSTWLQEAERSLTLIVNGIGSAVDPGMIILGGRLPEVLASALIERLHFYPAERRGFRRPSPPLRFAASPCDPVAVGAAMLPFQAVFFDITASILRLDSARNAKERPRQTMVGLHLYIKYCLISLY